jgi:hypothetical protein
MRCLPLSRDGYTAAKDPFHLTLRLLIGGLELDAVIAGERIEMRVVPVEDGIWDAIAVGKRRAVAGDWPGTVVPTVNTARNP